MYSDMYILYSDCSAFAFVRLNFVMSMLMIDAVSVRGGETAGRDRTTSLLIQSADRVRQLQRQLDDATEDFSRRLELQRKDFDDYRQRCAPLWEKELKERDSKILLYAVHRVAPKK